MIKLHRHIPVKVWIAETKKYDFPSLWDPYCGFLSDKEKMRLAGMSNRDHKINSLVSRYLLRIALSESDPRIHPEDWLIEEGEFGKPYLQNDKYAKNLQFNISHTKGYAACIVVENYECGIDVQSKNAGMNWEAISREILSDEEFVALQKIDDSSEKEKRFYQYWVMKESLLKGMGVGLIDDMKAHQILFCTDLAQPHKVIYKNDSLKWGCRLIDMPPDFFLGISVKQNGEFSVDCTLDVDLKYVSIH